MEEAEQERTGVARSRNTYKGSVLLLHPGGAQRHRQKVGRWPACLVNLQLTHAAWSMSKSGFGHERRATRLIGRPVLDSHL